MSGKVNNFAFLQTMNADRPSAPGSVVSASESQATRPVPSTFDREYSAKFILNELVSRKGPVGREELGHAAGLTAAEADAVLSYLGEAGLIDTANTEVTLSGFGRDALSVFTVS